jgi:hypothetical protein
MALRSCFPKVQTRKEPDNEESQHDGRETPTSLPRTPASHPISNGSGSSKYDLQAFSKVERTIGPTFVHQHLSMCRTE